MRQIVLDTETTGLDPEQGHRVIEIGCVEIINRRLSGNHYHQYLRPDREVDEGALEVHGISNEFLEDKPYFADVVDDFLSFIKGAELVIHNAPFDVGFLNHELRLLDPEHELLETFCGINDTLKMARQLHPGQKNNLDALCKRYMIDNSQRNLHGALLDAEILADVYLAMTGGQTALVLDAEEADTSGETSQKKQPQLRADHIKLLVQTANQEEASAHAAFLDNLRKANGGECVWDTVEAE